MALISIEDHNVVVEVLKREIERLQVEKAELRSLLKIMVAEYGEFYGDTPEVTAQYQSPLINQAMKMIDKTEAP